MVVAITIILIVAMICMTILVIFYIGTTYEHCNQYTLNDVRNIQEDIRKSIRHIEEQLKEQNNDR